MATIPPESPNAPAAPQIQPQLPVKTGLGPLAWVLIVVGSVFAICTVGLIVGGLFLTHKVKQAGFDPELMRKNPSLAVSKMITAANPNTEVISVDEDKGFIHIRDKQTGKTFTMNFADVKAGKMVFQEDGKDAVTITASGDGQKANVVVQTDGKDTVTMNASGDGQKANVVVQTNGKDTMTMNATGDDKNGTVEIKTSDGVERVGAAAAKAPAWMPVYPGSQPEGLVGADTAEGTTGSFHFVTKDSIEKVTQFYKEQLNKAGLKVASTTTNDADGSISGALEAEDAGKGRKVLIGYNTEDGGTSVTASFTEPK